MLYVFFLQDYIRFYYYIIWSGLLDDHRFTSARKLVVISSCCSVPLRVTMTNHEELVAEMATVEKMPIADRLKLAKKRRVTQLKNYIQFEKQSNKDKDRKTKESTSRIGERKTTQLRFSDDILLLDAAVKNDLVEGSAAEFCAQ